MPDKKIRKQEIIDIQEIPKKEKNLDYQLLLDFVGTRDLNKQPYYFTIKVGKYANPQDVVIISHLNNKAATGSESLMEQIKKCSDYKDYDYIIVELFSKFKKHELEAQTPFDTRRITLREPNQSVALRGFNTQQDMLGIVAEEIEKRSEIMKKDFEIAQLKIDKDRLEKNLKEQSFDLDELKNNYDEIKKKCKKLKKELEKTTEKSLKEIEDEREKTNLKNLGTTALTTFLAKSKYANKLGEILNGFIAGDETQTNQRTQPEYQQQVQEEQQEPEPQKELTKLDIVKIQLVKGIKNYVDTLDEDSTNEFYNVFYHITLANENLKNLSSLIQS